MKLPKIRRGKDFIDWCRVIMNQSTLSLIQNLDTSSMNALEISGRDWKKKCKFKEYTNVFYPEFDVCNPNPIFEKESYDIIFAEQVFEHVKDPKKGLQEVYNLLKPNGYFLITVPFFIMIHGSPEDYQRWTPDGFRIFLESENFKILELNSWGNKECAISYLSLDKLESFDPDKHSLENDPFIPLMIWALVQKNV